MDIFFVNKLTLFIPLSRNISFTATIHFPTQKSRDIFKYFWCINVFYLKCGFIITTVHYDGYFFTVWELIAEILSRPMVNLTSAYEHIPKIEQRIWVLNERCRAARHSIPFIGFSVMLTINTVLNKRQDLFIFTNNGWNFEKYQPQSYHKLQEPELQEASGDKFWPLLKNKQRRHPSQHHKTANQGCYLHGSQWEQAGWIKIYEFSIHEESGQ